MCSKKPESHSPKASAINSDSVPSSTGIATHLIVLPGEPKLGPFMLLMPLQVLDTLPRDARRPASPRLLLPLLMPVYVVWIPEDQPAQAVTTSNLTYFHGIQRTFAQGSAAAGAHAWLSGA